MKVTTKDYRILVMTAVAAERDAVLRGLNHNNKFDVQLAGVGPALAAATSAQALAASPYGLVISAGIAGGFSGVADIGSIVVASVLVAADLGAESTDGFLSLDELGFGSTHLPADSELALKLTAALCDAGLTAQCGPVLTVSTATGTASTALARASRIPGAAAEGMEGFGVASAAQVFSLPVLEIRAISNVVGPREREAWRIKDALAALEAAFSLLAEVLEA